MVKANKLAQWSLPSTAVPVIYSNDDKLCVYWQKINPVPHPFQGPIDIFGAFGRLATGFQSDQCPKELHTIDLPAEIRKKLEWWTTPTCTGLCLPRIYYVRIDLDYVIQGLEYLDLVDPALYPSHYESTPRISNDKSVGLT